MHPALFLDRDGVIIENVDHYVRSWADVRIFPEALAGLARLRDSTYKVVLVTNQSAIGRGIISLATVQSINERLLTVIQASGGRVDGIFMCPHAPEAGCDCRKPRPGLILQAAARLNLDLSRSVLVGDALTDIEAGRNAGIPTNILVRTGRGLVQAALPDALRLAPFLIYDDLGNIVDAICSARL